MALTTTQQQKLEEIKQEIQTLKEWVEGSPATLSNGGHGMFFFDRIQKMEKKINQLENA